MPGIDALMDAHDAGQEKLNGLIAVASAESTVLDARMAGLSAEEQRARRRKAAAKGLLTRARKDGSAAKIAAAAANYAKVAADADAVIDACIDQMQEVVAAGTASVGGVLDQTTRTWDAGSAVIDALSQPWDGPR